MTVLDRARYLLGLVHSILVFIGIAMRKKRAAERA
jgi:hypothetical protein